MSCTTFEEIYEIFLFKVQDYKQRNLFLKDANVATSLLQSYLTSAIAKFKECKKDIKNPDLKLGQFNCQLDIVEKNILANLMVEAWFDRMIDDIIQMNDRLSDTDFKTFSTANNMKEKSELRDKRREINDQDMWHYSFSNVPWAEWANGNYGI